MRALLVTSCLALTGCASLLGIDDFGTDDGVIPPGDTPTDPPDGGTPARITISGQTVLDRGDFGSPTIPSAPLVFVGRDEVLAEASTDASGDYAIAIPTGGVPLEGYLELAVPSDAFTPKMYAFGLTGDRNLLITAYSVDRIAQFAQVANATQATGTGVLFVKIVDSINGQGISGATIDTGGLGQIRYEDDTINGPGATTVQTGFFGQAWVFSIAGQVTVTVHAGGRSVSRTVDVDAQSYTTVGFSLAP